MSPLALLYYYIGFPGLGIKDFHVDSVALEIGDLEIRWYGVIIVCGIVAAFVYTYLHAKRHGLILDDLIDLTLSAVIPGVIGARAYYVFFDYLKNPQNYSEFIDFIAVWNGGLAIYGGLIAGLIT
ncbi:MAG: prolipoprotein diacylglyceryl transferase, partial [Clostridia bacterium]|nr:prolipoprotein diacylglyceryl transferase [Clostridia bacterium]